jgi:hypothetical protein
MGVMRLNAARLVPTLAILALAGCSKDEPAATTAAAPTTPAPTANAAPAGSTTTAAPGASASSAPADAMITATIIVDEKGFHPSSVTFPKGKPARLLFTRKTDETCAKKVVFPELNITRDLPLHANVAIDIPTDTARTLTFQCGMWMYKSSVVID